MESITEQTTRLAQTMTVVPGRRFHPLLLEQLGKHRAILRKAQQFFLERAETHQSFSATGEWLLDNYYVIQQTIRLIEEDLPKRYYRQLPCAAEGALRGYPRIYVLAREIMDYEQSLNLTVCEQFLTQFQFSQRLSMGELWAFPIMLRIRIIEMLNEHLVQFLNLPFPGVPGDSKSKGINNQTIAADAILNLRSLAVEDWNQFFESVSRVEYILREDPLRVYARMNFETRNRYREVIEAASKLHRVEEEEIARKAVELAFAAQDMDDWNEHDPAQRRKAHVGYYIVGEGQKQLEQALGLRLPFYKRIRRVLREHAIITYIGSITILTLFFTALPVLYGWLVGSTLLEQVLTALVVSLPASSLSVFIINWLATRLTKPKKLPQLDFKHEIPQNCRTLVVIPALIKDESEVEELARQLELHYLGNSDPNLRFGLLTDFADARYEKVPGDQQLLNHLKDAIQRLNQKYKSDSRNPFCLFHRDRKWNSSEGVWMGWERKRGKLTNLCQLIVDQEDHFSFSLCDNSFLESIRYLITLDADTLLPKGCAKDLIEICAHPLNEAVFDADGIAVSGYSILQPRVEIKPGFDQRSFFTSIYTGDTKLDLYTTTVSDVYQDLFAEASFIGKGIYDVWAFNHSLADKVPENALLSHDLFEGIHGRVGLATDVVLLEEFPPHYLSYIRRMHRWIRGDWQLLPWLNSKVPSPGGKKINNQLSVLDRWKIVDNLRRSLQLPSILVLFLAGWFFLPGSPWVWTSIGLLLPGLPFLTEGIQNLIQSARRKHWRGFFGEFLSVWRWVLAIVFLPYESSIIVHAIMTTLGRLWFTHQHLLQWTTTAHSIRKIGKRARGASFWREMFIAPIVAVLIGALLAVFRPLTLIPVSPLLLAWMVSPQIAYWICMPIEPKQKALNQPQLQELRSLARRTWFFFESFVGPEDHWLPPDNFQEDPREILAHRSSPTNIGLYLLSTLSAFDLGYIGLRELKIRWQNTFESMKDLERYRGHFLNWYETHHKTPLPPRYVSTVDSGNLAGCLLVVKQACDTIAAQPMICGAQWNGMIDILYTMKQSVLDIPKYPERDRIREVTGLIDELIGQIEQLSGGPNQVHTFLRTTCFHYQALLEKQMLELVRAGSSDLAPETLENLLVWAEQLRAHITRLVNECEDWFPWLSELEHLPDLFSDQEIRQDMDAHLNILCSLPPAVPNLEQMRKVYQQAELFVRDLRAALKTIDDPRTTEAFEWCERVIRLVREGVQHVNLLLADYEELSEQAERMFNEMDFQFLFDEHRKVFHIGYNLETLKLDANHYDLFASEDRIASLVAIAKGDVPQSHWLHLARPLTQVNDQRALLSWNGSMFEYLMPELIMRSYPDTLLGETHQAVIQRQIEYGHQHGIPWGISEAGFFSFDASMNYQYRGFGVPGLGYKRGLDEDLVITPYASLLALPYRPRAVLRNLRQLMNRGMLGVFGFYEAIDFTPSRLKLGHSYEIVQSYMVHHQSMIFISLANVLTNGAIIDRFHQNASIQNVEMLLQERVSLQVPVEFPHLERTEVRYMERRAEVTPWTPEPDDGAPQVHYLSNGRMGSLLSSTGSGFTRWNQIDLTRWRADTTLDPHGSWLYIQDLDQHQLWSAAFQPVNDPLDNQEVLFNPHKVEFKTQHHDLSLSEEIVIDPANDVEIRLVSLHNLSRHPREIRLTSYAELALAEHGADRRHPAFSKLFIENEFLPDLNALVFHRRPRTSEEEPVYVLQMIVQPEDFEEGCEFEIDRKTFLGRWGNFRAPAALRPGAQLRSIAEPTVEPVSVLSQRLRLGSNVSGFGLAFRPQRQPASCEFAWVTIAAESREKVIQLAALYQEWPNIHRAFDESLRVNQQEMDQWVISVKEIAHDQQLLSALFYPHKRLRGSPDRLQKNVRGQAGLWPYAISGDDPILLVRLDSEEQTGVLADCLKAHAYWRNRGLRIDLVILNMKDTSYLQDLQNQIHRMLNQSGNSEWLGRHGGIFLLRGDQMPEEDQILLETAARVVIDGKNGTLSAQLSRITRGGGVDLPAFVSAIPVDHYQTQTPALESPAALEFSNGFGGFSRDGREYLIYLRDGKRTPAPWINVIANERFGVTISEAGSGYTWAENSGENRLTEWRNDPVLDPPSEALYLRDEETGMIWSPTPLPAGHGAPTLIRHGLGYTVFEQNINGLEQVLRVFAAPNDPVKIIQLKLRNPTQHTRRLTATYYAEWALGNHRETMQQFITPEFNASHQVLSFRNRYHSDFAEHVAFLGCTRDIIGFTTDRAEFLGRLGDYQSPAALQKVGLTAALEAGNDPCAALQSLLWLMPGEEKEITFLLGEGKSTAHVLELIHRYDEIAEIDEAWDAIHQRWEQVCSTIRVNTPDPAVNLILNRWMLYQSLSCRIWGRTALYQSSGAFGFRDQLQDVMSLLFTAPEQTRAMILEAARRQFEEGDVLHWWHPPLGRGVRTRCSDDMLWLPYVTAEYVRVTGDESILDESVPFLSAPPLDAGEMERYGEYYAGEASASLYEHCQRAIAVGAATGVHGLPLIGSHDWNDGFSEVGARGSGESVWLAWFRMSVLKSFGQIARQRDDALTVKSYDTEAEVLLKMVEANAWDGQWYLRGYYDNGLPLGSSANNDCQIDSLGQSWAALSEMGDPERVRRALASSALRLVRDSEQIILLFTPPFDQDEQQPGYIKGYLPGVRENGGQYTHAATWLCWAFARAGDGDYAARLFHYLNPIYHADTPEKVETYQVEPYVIAADIYSTAPFAGRGGWTWYTGSAGWMYRLGISGILGFEKIGGALRVRPAVPKSWKSFDIDYRADKNHYHIHVENPDGVSSGVQVVYLDERPLPDLMIPLLNDGRPHQVRVIMGAVK
ncbi:MAG: hypothetical protein JW750_03360 [Anaerolineaceae bacterium]|nr:hypothetical protein [Anaerolineaceae bacterium]